MELNKDLIIVHFQEDFFDNTNQRIKNTVKENLQPLVDAAQTTDIHVSFWEDNTIANTASVIPIPPLSEKVSQLDAEKGLLNTDYPLKGTEIILAGGWFGSCINGAIETVMSSFVKSPIIKKTGELTIRILENAVYKQNNLLSELDDSKIVSGIQGAFNDSSAVSEPVVQNRGLRFKIIRTKTQEIITEQIVVPLPDKPKERMFDVIFLID
ncbi:hypothetical protein [Kordia sp.]|uniref:hypothetical protein n=1 Tax=Kordia sp. TaxID=1965332 RepID=UPI003D6A39CE